MAHGEKRGKHWRVRYKKPDGSWGSATRDDYGNRFTTRREAEQYGHALETDVNRRQFIDPQRGTITTREWADLWLASISVGPLSERDYRLRLRNHILKKWGSVPIRDLSPVAIATWEKELRANLSKNYVDGIMSTFRTMLSDAVTSEIRGTNPVVSRTSGRRGKFRPKPKEKKVIATPRQALLVARNGLAMRGLNEYAMVLTSAYTGLRIGELAGIRRDQVELVDTGSGARIHALHQSQYVGGEFTELDAKYDSGRGLIIPPFLASLLRQLIGLRPHGEWVFTAPKGGRLIRGGDWYTETWRPMVNGRAPRPVVRGAKARVGVRPVLGVAGMVPHGLRHSHKVWLDEDGHPRVAVEERMGHELQGIEGTYSHTTLSMELKIAESLQTRFEQSLKTVVDRRELGPFPAWDPAAS